MKPIDDKTLMEEAIKARENSYAPYSNYRVGAALLTKSGKIYCGCNIENSAYSATVCAERVAVFKAVSENAGEIIKIAICGGKDRLDPSCMPCGECRQVLSEFSSDIEIITGDINSLTKSKISELLPSAFKI